MQRYRKRDMLNLSKKNEVIAQIKALADKNLSHLFTLDEETISNVLKALSYYCEHQGVKALPKFYEHILLTMVQWEDGACGHRFELWAM